jgi:hypothetical protein
MIRMTSFEAAIGVLLLGATLAIAQGDPGGLPPGNDATLRDTPAVNSALPKLVPGSAAPDGDLGEHQVTGKVSALDPTSGTLVVNVNGRDLRVLFPASALTHLEKGDEVTVTVAVHKNSPGGPN